TCALPICLLARLFQQALLFEPCIFCLSFRLLCDAERGLLLSLGLGHGFRHFFEAIASARKFASVIGCFKPTLFFLLLDGCHSVRVLGRLSQGLALKSGILGRLLLSEMLN